MFPIENMAARPVPLRGVQDDLGQAFVSAGAEVVQGDVVEQFLERHRLRYTGGIEGPSASAAHDELGVDAVLLAAVHGYEAQPPRISMTARLVAAEPSATVLWLDGIGRVGTDSPGFLGMGIVNDYRTLETSEFRRIARSAIAALDGAGPRGVPCPAERRFRPRIAYRAPHFDASGSYSVAVLPFVNETNRRRAGDIVTLEVARQLAAVRRLRVIEPGEVRNRLIRHRVVMEGGISLDVARTVVDTLQADLVVTGYVRDYTDGTEPSVNFTILVLEKTRGAVVWESTSHGTGSEGVWFFDAGFISTASALACRIGSSVVDSFLGDLDMAPRVERASSPSNR